MTRRQKKHRGQMVIALDAYFIPMNEITRRRAMKAIASGRAQALDIATFAQMGVAEVATKPLHAIVFPSAKAVGDVRLGRGGFNSVFRRDNHRCQYVGCNNRGSTLDHVRPRCQGGRTTYTNLVSCCPSCNTRKGGRTPEQAGMQLKKPIRSPLAILMERFQSLVDEARGR